MGSNWIRASGRPEPPSVLRVRADCGGRIFTAKLGVVVRNLAHQLLNQLLTDDAILLAFICLSGIDLSDPAVAGFSAHCVTICHELRHFDQLIRSEHGGTDRLAIRARFWPGQSKSNMFLLAGAAAAGLLLGGGLRMANPAPSRLTLCGAALAWRRRCLKTICYCGRCSSPAIPTPHRA